jgi:uncharacterized protein YbcV (DUF1398 family)
MDFEHAIRDAKRRANEGKFRYPAYATLLVGAGVSSYTVDVATRQTEYFGKKGEKHTETGGTQRAIAATYDASALDAAIKLSQRGEIEYPEFMDKLAAAGVATYEARVGERVVVYEGHGKQFMEAIPR